MIFMPMAMTLGHQHENLRFFRSSEILVQNNLKKHEARFHYSLLLLQKLAGLCWTVAGRLIPNCFEVVLGFRKPGRPMTAAPL